MGLFYVRDRGTVFFLTVAPFKINGFMKTVCFFRKAELSISQCYQHNRAALTKKNPKDRLKIDVTTRQNRNQCNLYMCMIMCMLCVCVHAADKGAGSQAEFPFFHPLSIRTQMHASSL